MIEKININKIFINSVNPRLIKDHKFNQLVKSIKEFPEMLKLRPIIVNEEYDILGGNMRYKACQELGMEEVWIIKADNLNDKQIEQFVIKDNIGFGEWDWDMLANTWSPEELKEWGLDVWQPEEEVDYSILDDDDLADDLSDMKNGVKKAIQIEFELEHYDEASDLVRLFRNKGNYVGGMIMDYLREQKNNL